MNRQKTQVDIALKKRMLPDEVLGEKGEIAEKIRDAIKRWENDYRIGDLSWQDAYYYTQAFREMGTDIICSQLEQIDRIIFLPRNSDFLLSQFIIEPRVVSMIGRRHSGKTISAYTLGLAALDELSKKFGDCQLYVLNDEEGIAEILAESDNRIDVLDSPNDIDWQSYASKPEIILYNEMIEEQQWQSQHSKQTRMLNIGEWRQRHNNRWIIRNAISYAAYERSQRENIDINVFRWMSPPLYSSTVEKMPKVWKPLLDVVLNLSIDEGLCFCPIIGQPGKKSGDVIYIHVTRPPKFLLEIDDKARHRKHQRRKHYGDRKYWTKERLQKLKEDGLSYQQIADQTGIPKTTVHDRINDIN